MERLVNSISNDNEESKETDSDFGDMIFDETRGTSVRGSQIVMANDEDEAEDMRDLFESMYQGQVLKGSD